MLEITPRLKIPLNEIHFEAIRSSGPGGQHVNKVSSCVRLLFAVEASNALNPFQKKRIQQQLGNRINQEGQLYLVCQAHRSQGMNRKAALERLQKLLKTALHKPKYRVPTKISRSKIEKRLKSKKETGKKKKNRQSNRQIDY